MRRLAGVLAGVALAAGAALVPMLPAAPQTIDPPGSFPTRVDAALTVAPTAAVPGEPVTISGNYCVFELTNGQGSSAPANIPGVVTGTVGFTPELAFGPITAGADGTWSTTIVVPAGTPPGSYSVNAACTLPSADETSARAQQIPALRGFLYEAGTVVVAARGPLNFTG